MARASATCPACGARGTVAVAPPRAGGMLSDGRPCGASVRRLHCRRCGLGWLPATEAARLPRRTFGPAYGLGAAPPGPSDIARADGYAARIAALAGAAPSSVLDVGCGNGALLAALTQRWPEARLAGIEPAPRVAAAARLAGLSVAPALRRCHRAALVMSVNVVEHTPDPTAFLRTLRGAAAPGGRILVICPDGQTPWLELLMADHRWSLTPAALAHFAARAGLRVLAAQPAPGGFQAALLAPARARIRPHRGGSHAPAARRVYLGGWRGLDAALLDRLPTWGPLTGFGAGEAAWLLRRHAPRSWARLGTLAADGLPSQQALGLPVVPPPTDGRRLLLAVRPGSQPALVSRFGPAAIRWDDLITG